MMAPLSKPDMAAILMISLGEEKSSKVIEKLSEKSINDLALRIGKTKMVQAQEKLEVLRECRMLMLAQEYISQGGLPYARSLLSKALPEERVDTIIDQVERHIEGNPFDFMEKAPPDRVSEILRTEHPQTIALILANLSRPKASEILVLLPAETRLDIIKRIAEMDEMKPEVVDLLKKSLKEQMKGFLGTAGDAIGGVEAVAEILNLIPQADERAITQGLQAETPEMAEEIGKLMFTFDQIANINDRQLQAAMVPILQDLSTEGLAVCLKLCDADLKEKLLNSISANNRNEVLELFDGLPMQPMKDVEARQQEFITLLKQQADEGVVTISASGEQDTYI